MVRKNIGLYTLFFLLSLIFSSGTTANAQESLGLRISEVLVDNQTNCIDDYGNHSPWIEICNLSENSIDIGGYFLTDDSNNLTKCWIPEGDKSTIILPNNYLVLWADGKPSRGILHIGLDLNNVKTLLLVSPKGDKIVDKIEITLPQKTDVTYGRLNPTQEECDYLSISTPGTKNDLSRKVDEVKNVDMSNITNLAIILGIAFILIVLFVFFIKKRKKEESKITESTPVVDDKSTAYEEVLDEVNVAIAMSFYLYENEIHDNENLVLTLQKVSRTYSPWSSKIYTLRKLPR